MGQAAARLSKLVNMIATATAMAMWLDLRIAAVAKMMVMFGVKPTTIMMSLTTRATLVAAFEDAILTALQIGRAVEIPWHKPVSCSDSHADCLPTREVSC